MTTLRYPGKQNRTGAAMEYAPLEVGMTVIVLLEGLRVDKAKVVDVWDDGLSIRLESVDGSPGLVSNFLYLPMNMLVRDAETGVPAFFEQAGWRTVYWNTNRNRWCTNREGLVFDIIPFSIRLFA